jgi:CheY-like chemotaxis protein/anti-sigma regulatory factor (Ser/Thr protein kinase)
VVQNLVTNAIKYTPRGGSIAVSVRREGEQAVLRVKDDGIGIEPASIERIFDLFTQVDTSIERSRGGLGIGLTLTRRLVESHGGSIRAESAGKNRGSELIVTLPLGDEDHLEPSSHALAAVVEEEGERLHVLLVEDNEDVRLLTERLIRRWGHDVVTAETGRAGLDLALTQHPDVALIDIGLPELDGFEIARRIRERDDGDRMLLVAVTGYGRVEDRAESEAAGFDRHLTKPVEPTELRRLLSDAARQAPAR